MRNARRPAGPSPADLYLARLAARPPYRRTIYTAFALTAIAALVLRVALGREEQILPWYGVVLSAYGLGMALAAREARSRVVYACFGLLVAAAFTRRFATGWTREVGVVEVLACLGLLAAFHRLCRSPLAGGAPREAAGRPHGGAVLKSDASQQPVNQEDSNEQGSARGAPRRGTHDRRPAGKGQGQGGEAGG